MRWSNLTAVLVPLAVLARGAVLSERSTSQKPVSRPAHGSQGGHRLQVADSAKGVIVQMFEWTWDSVASECTNFLGPSGYRFVQTSPAQEHVQGDQWWTDYQPVSYQLTSKRGDRAAFSRMVQTCKDAGVGIVADTIWNHMSGAQSGTGVAGTSFTHYDYPGTYANSAGDFHHCGLEPNDQIVNYGNRQEVQTCELVGLADLATETEHVRSRLVQYANDLLSLGVEGLRLDAAKHMAATDVLNMTKRLTSSVYITQEVIWGSGEPIQPNEYLGSGEVQEFRYSSTLLDAFTNGGLQWLQDLDNRGWVPSGQATVFVSNHDTERNGASLNANSPNNIYTLAHVFMLAHPYGTPSVLSSYSFSNTDAGSPNGGTGSCSDNGGANGWYCQHRWPAVAGMVSFRNTTLSLPLNNFIADGSARIAFSRGAAGFVAINNADAPWSAGFSAALPAGRYCDVVGGRVSGGGCVGVTYSVDAAQKLTVIVPPRSAIALHIGGASVTTAPGSRTKVVFGVTKQTVFGENVFIVGSIPELGGWDTSKAIPLSSSTYPTWTGTVTLAPNTAYQYKYLQKESDGSIVWESDPNRSGTSPKEGSVQVQDAWR